MSENYVVSRTLLAPSEQEGLSQAQAAWDLVRAWDDGPQDIGCPRYVEEGLKELFPDMDGPVVTLVDSHTSIGGDGKKRYSISFDYVTQTDYVRITYPFDR